MIQKKWFRVEHLKDGSIGTVTEVESKGRNGAVVRFYEATDKPDACRQAKNWYEKRLSLARAHSKAAIDRARSAGLCTTCKRRKSRPGLVSCQECADLLVALKRQRRERRRNGDTTDLRRVYKTSEDAYAATMKKHKASNDRYRAKAGGYTARLYLCVLKKFDALGPVAFRAWLVSKIPALNSQWHPPMAEEQMPEAAE